MSKLFILLGLAGLICCLVLGVNAWVRASDTVGIAKEAFDLINEKRVEMDRPALIWDDELATKAIQYSQHMKDTGEFIHSDMNYVENILHSDGGFPSGNNVYNPWLISYGHFSNMVDSDLQYGAIGIVGEYATFLAR